MEIKIKDAKASAFRRYGELVEFSPADKATVDLEKVTFWKQQAIYKIKGLTEIGVLKIRASEMKFNELENHFKTPTVIIPMDGDFIMAVAAPSEKVPSTEHIEAFLIKKYQIVVLDEKVWHGTTYPVDKTEQTFLIFFEKDTLENDTVMEALTEDCRLIK